MPTKPYIIMWVLSCIPRHIEEYRKLQKLKMAPHLLATNESVIGMGIIYRGGNEKPYGWLAVYRLYSNWGYAWDCMRIDNSTINREIIVILLFGKRCLYIVLFNHCIFLHELMLLLFSMSTVYRRIFTIIIAIHQQIVCTSLICG